MVSPNLDKNSKYEISPLPSKSRRLITTSICTLVKPICSPCIPSLNSLRDSVPSLHVCMRMNKACSIYAPRDRFLLKCCSDLKHMHIAMTSHTVLDHRFIASEETEAPVCMHAIMQICSQQTEDDLQNHVCVDIRFNISSHARFNMCTYTPARTMNFRVTVL